MKWIVLAPVIAFAQSWPEAVPYTPLPGERAVAPLIAFDGAGNFYVASAVERSGFEIAVRQYSPDGTLRYSTLIGGADSAGPTALAVSSAGVALVGFGTQSAELPLVNPVQRTPGGGFSGAGGSQDAAFVRLSPTGAITQLSYLSGGGSERITAIAFDDGESAYMTGFTSSADFPVRNALPPPQVRNWIGFATKLTPGGAIEWSTLFGGERTQPAALAVHDGAAVIGGTTWGSFPTTDAAWSRIASPGRNGFVIKLGLNPFGAPRVQFATVLRIADVPFAPFAQDTPESDITALAVDARGAVYATGWTSARDFGDHSAANPCVASNQYPVVAQWSNNAVAGVLVKLDAAGSRTDFATCLEDVRPSSLVLDAAGAVTVAGPAQTTGLRPFRAGCDSNATALMKFGPGESRPLAVRCLPGTRDVKLAAGTAASTYLAGLEQNAPSLRRITLCGPVRVSPSSLEFPMAGGRAAVTVSAPQGCAWELRPLGNWLRVASGAVGTGAGSAVVEADSADTFRQAAFVVGGGAVSVVQHDRSAPVIDEFASSAVLVASGGIVDLTWRTRNANTVRLTGMGEVASSATVRRYVYQDTEFQLDASGPGGSASASVKVFTTRPNGGQTEALNSPRVRRPAPGEVVDTVPVVFDWIDGVVPGNPGQPPRLTITTRTGARTERVVDMVGAASQWRVPLLDGDYRATLARCGDQACFYDVSWDFSVKLRPLAAATGLTADGEILSWQPVADATRYEIEIVRDGAVFRQTSAAMAPFSHELPGGTYRTRVRPCHLVCGGWSELVEFDVAPPAAIDQAPVIRGRSPLAWDSVPGAAWYRYTVWEEAAVVATWRVDAGSVQPAARPNPHEVSVAACNAGGCGPESNRVAMPAAPPGWPLITETGATVAWTPVPGARTYQLTVTDLTTQDRVFDRVLTGLLSTPLSLQGGGRRYRARIIATVMTQVGLRTRIDTYAGPAVDFQSDGAGPSAPTPANVTVTGTLFDTAHMKVTVSPLPGASSYQTTVRRQADAALVEAAVSPTPVLFHRLPRNGFFRIAARACLATVCNPNSDEGWTPWSTDAGIPDLLYPQ